MLVMSNTGDWEYDQWGVVGTIEHEQYATVQDEFKKFVKKTCDGLYFGRSTYVHKEMPVATYVEGTKECRASMKEHGVKFLCAGVPVAYIIHTAPDCVPEIFYLIEMKWERL